jgi:hypothetical protein
MANIPIWPGSSSFFPGDTPFGFYDYDSDFQTDADKVAKFCALRLGYPLENVELQNINFYTAFEEATTVYGNELYAYKQREDYLSLEGSSNSYSNALNIDFSASLITPNMGPIIRLSEQYGTEAGVGGNVTWYSGSVIVTGSQQDYDLGEWAIENNLTGSDIEIKKVFYESLPASWQFYGGLGYTGTAIAMFGSSAGLTSYGGNSFLMMPLSFDLQAIQQVEMFRDVLFSQYTFQLINNKLRIFPIPDVNESGGRIWFQYLLKSERMSNSISTGDGNVVNISQMPYRNVPYASVNSVGRSWIFEMTLAISKEMLGYVRGKYTQVPIPGAAVTLNQSDLIQAATNEKTALITRLREYFDQTSRQSLLERRQAESVARKSELGEVPMTIFIG